MRSACRGGGGWRRNLSFEVLLGTNCAWEEIFETVVGSTCGRIFLRSRPSLPTIECLLLLSRSTLSDKTHHSSQLCVLGCASRYVVKIHRKIPWEGRNHLELFSLCRMRKYFPGTSVELKPFITFPKEIFYKRFITRERPWKLYCIEISCVGGGCCFGGLKLL